MGSHSKSRFLNKNLKALIELHTINELKKHNILKTERDESSIDLIKNAINNKDVSHNSSNTNNKSKNSFVSNIRTSNLGLENDQASLMISALEIGNVKAKDLMVPLNSIYKIDYNAEFTKDLFDEIIQLGYSRIPVYKNASNHCLCGILLTKKLIGNTHLICSQKAKNFKDYNLKLSKPIIVSPELSLINLLREFRSGRSHMAFVTKEVNTYQKILGLDEENSELSFISKQTVDFNLESDQNLEVLGKLNKIINLFTFYL